MIKHIYYSLPHHTLATWQLVSQVEECLLPEANENYPTGAICHMCKERIIELLDRGDIEAANKLLSRVTMVIPDSTGETQPSTVTGAFAL